MKKNIHIKAVITTICFIALIGLNAIHSEAATKKMSDGNLFDAEFYAATYQDVKNAIGTDEATLYKHFLDYGKNEGRLPYEGYVTGAAKVADNVFIDNFDATYYANTYPDVVKALGNDPQALYNHYVTYGKKEGRLPNSTYNNGISAQSSAAKSDNSKTAAAGTTSSVQKSTSNTVYIASSGKGTAYHSRANCGRLKSSTAISLSEAQRRGYTACKNCH